MAASLLSLTQEADKGAAADIGTAADKGGKGSVDSLLKSVLIDMISISLGLSRLSSVSRLS